MIESTSPKYLLHRYQHHMQPALILMLKISTTSCVSYRHSLLVLKEIQPPFHHSYRKIEKLIRKVCTTITTFERRKTEAE
jgi:hypothetical protein